MGLTSGGVMGHCAYSGMGWNCQIWQKLPLIFNPNTMGKASWRQIVSWFTGGGSRVHGRWFTVDGSLFHWNFTGNSRLKVKLAIEADVLASPGDGTSIGFLMVNCAMFRRASPFERGDQVLVQRNILIKPNWIRTGGTPSTSRRTTPPMYSKRD